MTRAAIALGSNLGDRRRHLLEAVESIADLGVLVKVSGLYETAPVGGPEQDDYLNAVAVIDTTLPAERLLLALHEIEADHDRERTVRWGARTLDLDLLLYGADRVDTEICTVPHPRLTERRFVVEPLLEAWPDARLPDGTRVARFTDSVGDQEVTNLGEFWSETGDPAGFGGRGGWWVVAQFILIGVVMWAIGLGGPEIPGEGLPRAVGAVAALMGGVQAALGILQLGDRLTPFPEPLDGGGIIHGGIYSIVRHPIYGGIVMGLVGIALFQRSLLALGLALASGVFFWRKAAGEEERLVRRFPHYSDYQAETRARLVPWVL